MSGLKSMKKNIINDIKVDQSHENKRQTAQDPNVKYFTAGNYMTSKIIPFVAIVYKND